MTLFSCLNWKILWSSPAMAFSSSVSCLATASTVFWEVSPRISRLNSRNSLMQASANIWEYLGSGLVTLRMKIEAFGSCCTESSALISRNSGWEASIALSARRLISSLCMRETWVPK